MANAIIMSIVFCPIGQCRPPYPADDVKDALSLAWKEICIEVGTCQTSREKHVGLDQNLEGGGAELG